MSKNELFTDVMRKTTRKLHKYSDQLVTLKFSFAITNDSVMSESLSIFYELFKYLENAIERLDDNYIAKFRTPELNFTERFEMDLEHYFGDRWRDDYRPANRIVRKYLNHLRYLETNKPELLVVYVYHLYLGLLSGGQLIKKRINSSFIPKLVPPRVCAIFDFDQKSVSRLKNRIKNEMNEIAGAVDEEMRQKWLKESKILFALNIKLIRTVKCPGSVVLNKCLPLILPVLMLPFAVILYFYNDKLAYLFVLIFLFAYYYFC